MAQIIRMPSVLAGSEEAAIANWLVTEGQVIAVGEPLAEIETEKAIVEYNAEEAGIVGRVVLAAGESGEIGAPIAVLIAEGETDADIDAALGGAPAAAPAGAAGPTDAPAAPSAPTPVAESAAPAPESGTPARDPESGAPVAEAASVAEAAATADTLDPAPSTGATATTTGAAPAGPAAVPGADGAPGAANTTADTGVASGDRLFVSPIARKLARQQGLDPAAITGSGPGGRIVRRDVEAALAAGTASVGTGTSATGTPAAASAAPSTPAAPAAPTAGAAAPAATPSGDWDLIPHTGMRRAIARRLTESKSTVPHFYLTAEPRVDALLALRAEVNAQSPVRVSVNDFVVKAVAAAFADVPEANVTWSDEGMRKHHAVDIAVAVATEGGLVTPVVRGVDTKSLTAVSSTIGELVAKAKDKRLKQDELEGGSFSVSNLGMYGTVEFSAILNPPQSGILAVGAAKQQAVVIDGELAVATVMRCTLSVDHRAVDGALAAQWLAAFTKRIENPLSILL